jgi:hypothetical protein
MPLSDNDIKSELSYVYLHAVATRAGCTCERTGRLVDNLGIDARVAFRGQLNPRPSRSYVEFLIQLKSTSQDLAAQSGRFPLDLEVAQYENLRQLAEEVPCFLVVLRLPRNAGAWLKCSPQALTLKRCAYWLCMCGAPASANRHTQRVFLRLRNRFSVDSLRQLMTRFACEEPISYEA